MKTLYMCMVMNIKDIIYLQLICKIEKSFTILTLNYFDV